MKPHNKKYLSVINNIAKGIETYLSGQPELHLRVQVTPMLDVEDKQFDIAIQKKRTEEFRIVINVCKTIHIQDCYSRLMIRQTIFQLDEIFVYDYQKGNWIANNCAETSYSNLLKLELSHLLK